jgi:hypothetical protein
VRTKAPPRRAGVCIDVVCISHSFQNGLLLR